MIQKLIVLLRPWVFSIYQKISENFDWEFWEFPFGKRAFHLSQVPFVYKPLRRFTKKPDALVNCSAIFWNASLFVAFPSNKWLLLACVVMRSLTSACSRRSRFTVVETSPVNERTFQSCSCNILVFTRETCTGKESFETSKNFYLPLLYKARSCCNKFPWSDARTWQAEYS